MSSQRLSLEHPLQRRKVYDQHLSDQTQGHSDQEHLIGEQSHLEHGFRLRPTRERVEHVEENEAGEGHRRVARGYSVV